uniref:Uncharacterized protein n=1 Tax=Tanacetum cinerariifolium TaxID=118510 RepID=A0A6L2K5C4_TANCI|nr:hypothetical protein [Tanacetum cinerariifolium]
MIDDPRPAAGYFNMVDVRHLNSWGKGIMVDDVVTSSAGSSRPRPSFDFVSSFRDVSGDAIHADFFPFSASPYYAT